MPPSTLFRRALTARDLTARNRTTSWRGSRTFGRFTIGCGHRAWGGYDGAAHRRRCRTGIGPGHGITASGELVLLSEQITISLEDIPELDQLNVRLGLSRLPQPPQRNRTGVFIVALRPVEFTANPIASYPTSITGTRSAEDSDIVEAAAVTLIPFGDGGRGQSANAQRAQLARNIFVLNQAAGVPVDALPLALVYLERNQIQWIDPFLVRREVGADHGDILGLGFAPRAVREAHMIQYNAHLEAVMTQRSAASQGLRFAASEYFQALPPAGRLPAAAVNPADFTQVFFPPEVDVDLAIIPEDEVIALIEESYLLPPIDLTVGGDNLESVDVVVLLPVPRARFRELHTQLTPPPTPPALESPAVIRPLRAAAVGMIAKRRPLEVLTGLRIARRNVLGLDAPVDSADPVDVRWQQELNAPDLRTLWYVRRRNLAYVAAVTGEPLALITPPPPEPEPEPQPEPEPDPNDDPVNPFEDDRVAEFIEKFDMADALEAVQGCLTRRHWEAIREVLIRDRLLIGDENVLARNFLLALLRTCKEFDGKIPDAVMKTLLDRYNQDSLGVGLSRLTMLLELPELRRAVAEADFAVDLDVVLAKMTATQLRSVDRKVAAQPDVASMLALLEEVARS
ncbi:MAG: hypothetical protein R2873_20895 [Caldilineaceae bacterium]